MMVAEPLPNALATPAFSLPCELDVLVLIGNVFGAEESQVTVLVRSLTLGVVENVPIARNWPVSFNSPTLIEPGIMVSDSSGSGAAERLTETLAVAETTEPSAFVQIAEIVVVPALTPVASPVALTVAMVGILELHVILGELVTSVSNPLPDVPSAMN